MTRTKATMRGLPKVVVNLEGRIGNKNILNRRPRIITFKIKKLLPQSKVVEVKNLVK